MNQTVVNVQKELGVRSCSSRVLERLAVLSGLKIEYVSYVPMGPRAKKAPNAIIYGVRRPSSKGYRMTGSAKECAEYMASEIEEK